MVAVVAATTRYMTVVKEMNMFFHGKIVVVARGVIVVQSFPIGGVLPEDVVDKLNGIQSVEATVPMLFNLEFPLNSQGFQSFPVNVTMGVPVGNWSMLVGSTQLKKGSWPSSEFSRQVVIGASLADQYNVTIGSPIKIKNHRLNVSGIMETRSAFLSRLMIMPLKLAQEVYKYPMQVNMAVVTVDKEVDEQDMTNRIEETISYVTAISDDERENIVKPLISDVEKWNVGIQSVLSFISMVLVALVAMINVSERRKDFATLIAIGASRWFIIRMVIIETLLIGLIGGLIGLLFGTIGALWLGSSYTGIPITLFFPGVLEVVPFSLMIGVLASTLAVSCIAGIIPSIAAARMNITEVLRTEY